MFTVFSEKHPLPCPSPYGDNIEDNIRRVLEKQKDAEPASRVYLSHLGLPWQGGTFVNVSTTAGSTLDSRRSRSRVTLPTVVLAASANHYQELQALLHNIHTSVNRDGRLKVVFYDLGLDPFQLSQVGNGGCIRQHNGFLGVNEYNLTPLLQYYSNISAERL